MVGVRVKSTLYLKNQYEEMQKSWVNVQVVVSVKAVVVLCWEVLPVGSQFEKV